MSTGQANRPRRYYLLSNSKKNYRIKITQYNSRLQGQLMVFSREKFSELVKCENRKLERYVNNNLVPVWIMNLCYGANIIQERTTRKIAISEPCMATCMALSHICLCKNGSNSSEYSVACKQGFLCFSTWNASTDSHSHKHLFSDGMVLL